ncbi:MAG: discoidin domain-containing protein [Acidobacteriota bacterium]|nr:discoidin domain-containing protein [Acidobacteriota bacterium]
MRVVMDGNGGAGAVANFDYFRLTRAQAVLGTNLALGKPAAQSSDVAGGVASRAVDGNTSGDFWANGSVTHTNYDAQAWWQVDLGDSQYIGEVKVWNRTDCCGDRLSNFYVFVSDQPFTSTDLNTTINQAGVSSYHTSGQGGTPTTLEVNRTGRYVRVQLAGTNYLMLAEVEVIGTPGGGGGGGSAPSIEWLISDHLGTPRMIADRTGGLAGIKRHDYLPFGEEVGAGVGGRTTGQGYVGSNLRQKWAQLERDGETGLDYAQARYYSSVQGRFTAVDPLLASGRPANPQTFNRYNYCGSNPVNCIDPTGLDWWYDENAQHPSPTWFNRDPGSGWKRWTESYSLVYQDTAQTGYWIALNRMQGQAYITNTYDKAVAKFNEYNGGSRGLSGLSQAGLEFAAGVTTASPIGIFFPTIYESQGLDTTSRDFNLGMVVGAGVGFGAGAFSRAAVVAGESGSYGSLVGRSVVGDGLTPHHMPQAALNFTSYADGGALVLPHVEHVLTRTYGRAGAVTAQAERGLPFRTVLARDIGLPHLNF